MSIEIQPIIEKTSIPDEPTARQSFQTKLDQDRNVEIELQIKEIEQEKNPHKLLTRERVGGAAKTTAGVAGGLLSLVGPDTAKMVMMAGAGFELLRSAKDKIGGIVQQRRDYKEFEKDRLRRIEELRNVGTEPEELAPTATTSVMQAGGILSASGMASSEMFQSSVLQEMQRSNDLFAQFLDELRDRRKEESGDGPGAYGRPTFKKEEKEEKDDKKKGVLGKLKDLASNLLGRKTSGLLGMGMGGLARGAGGLLMGGLGSLGGLVGGGALAGAGVLGLGAAAGYGGYKLGSFINKNILGEDLLSKLMGVDKEPETEPKLRKTLSDKLKEKAQKGDAGVLKQAIRVKDQKLITEKEYEDIVDAYNKNKAGQTGKATTDIEQKADRILEPATARPVASAGPSVPAIAVPGPAPTTSTPSGVPTPIGAPSATPSGAGVMQGGPLPQPTPTVPPIAGPAPTMGEMQSSLMGQLQKEGITDPVAVSNIMAQVQAESAFKPKSENLNYSPKTLMRLFGPGNEGGNKVRVRSMEEAQAIVSQGPEAIGNLIYGGRMGNTADEGFKYRGRGLVQLTGKSNYEEIGKKLGIDLVANPDLANDPRYAPQIAATYYATRSKGKDLRDINQVSKITGHATGASGNKQRAQFAQAFLGKIQGGEIQPKVFGAESTSAPQAIPVSDQPSVPGVAPIPQVAPSNNFGTMLASASNQNASLQTAVSSKQMSSGAMPMPVVAGGGGGGGGGGPQPSAQSGGPSIKPRAEEPYFYEMQKKALISSIV